MEAHPYANIFPMLGQSELRELADDIKAYGLRHAIVIDKSRRIIDGRNRFAACEIADVEPKFETFDGDDRQILERIVSLNIKRRHLDESQRAMVAARIASLSQGRPSKSQPEENRPKGRFIENGPTQAEAAATLNVGERSVRRAKRIINDGVEELQDAVMAGEITVVAAERIVVLPEVEQKAAVQEAKAPKSPQGAAPKKPAKPEIPATAKSLIEAIKSLRAIAAKDTMRLSIVELREVVKRVEEAARHYVGRFME